jgi:hypothetical protein
MFRLKEQTRAAEPPSGLLFERSRGNSEATKGFVALSYCWRGGWEPAPACELRLKNSLYHERLPISDQCFQETLKWVKPGEGIWIDQLCIDQSNEKEKAKAIPLMNLLYKNARRVVIVLEDIKITEEETRLLEELQACSVRREMVSFAKCLETKAPTVWNLICRIGNARWFQRAWCSHEFHLCQDAVFIIPCHSRRSSSLELNTLEELLRFKGNWRPASTELPKEQLEGYRKLVLLLTSRYILKKGYILDPPVVGICYLINNCQATELCDKVSIALNLLGLRLSFHGNVLTDKHALYIFTLLALAAGDPLSLCCTGMMLGHGDNEWSRTVLDLSYLQ